MADLSLYIGGDLSASSTGSLQLATGTTLGQQRVLRRLITAPNDYLWHPTYGAGLPQAIGELADVAAITALIRANIALESVVATTPDPIITVRPISNGVFVEIRYQDANTGEPTVLAFDVTR